MLLAYFIAESNESQAVQPTWRKVNSGRYCCVPQCSNSSGRNKFLVELNVPKVSFHSFPDINSAKGKLWLKLFGVILAVILQLTTVASDYYLPLGGERYLLKSTAAPSRFPWRNKIERTSMSSQNALQVSDDFSNKNDSLWNIVTEIQMN